MKANNTIITGAGAAGLAVSACLKHKGVSSIILEQDDNVPSIFNKEGTPLTTGMESAMRGLYFCGYYVSPTDMLREIAIEAEQIAKIIATKP